jgi:hypothetical protein
LNIKKEFKFSNDIAHKGNLFLTVATNHNREVAFAVRKSISTILGYSSNEVMGLVIELTNSIEFIEELFNSPTLENKLFL